MQECGVWLMLTRLDIVGIQDAAEQLEAPSTCSWTWTGLAAKLQSIQLKNPAESE